MPVLLIQDSWNAATINGRVKLNGGKITRYESFNGTLTFHGDQSQSAKKRVLDEKKKAKGIVFKKRRYTRSFNSGWENILVGTKSRRLK